MLYICSEALLWSYQSTLRWRSWRILGTGMFSTRTYLGCPLLRDERIGQAGTDQRPCWCYCQASLLRVFCASKSFLRCRRRPALRVTANTSVMCEMMPVGRGHLEAASLVDWEFDAACATTKQYMVGIAKHLRCLARATEGVCTNCDMPISFSPTKTLHTHNQCSLVLFKLTLRLSTTRATLLRKSVWTMQTISTLLDHWIQPVQALGL